MTDTTKETWVYVGQILERSGKTSHKWLEVSLDDGDHVPADGSTDPHYFGKNIVSNAGVGSVYEVSVIRSDDAVSVKTGGPDAPKFLRMWPWEEMVERWHAEHRGTLATVAARRERQRATADAPTMFDMTLKELRDVITGTNWMRRDGIVGAAITYLMSGER